VTARVRRAGLGWAVALAFAATAHAHGDAAPGARSPWSVWTWDAWTVALLGLSALLYARGLAALWRESGVGHGVRRWEAASFAAGWIVLALALVSPLHSVGELLFSVHMTQHEVLMLVAAPLLALSRPLLAFLWGMPLAWRRTVGRAARRAPVQRSWRGVTNPLVAWCVHAVALWIWHVPALFQATLHSDLAHALQHASFLLSALLFWWALIHRGPGWMGYGAAVLYVFTTSLHGGLLGALLTLAPHPWYPAYARTAPEFGLTALEDQQLGGLIMWIPAATVYLVAALALLAGWLREAELAHGRRREPSSPERRGRAGAAGIVATLALLLLACGSTGCDGGTARTAHAAGDPERGRAALRTYGCASCHTIPGVRGADGLVGPPLGGVTRRMYLAGAINNTEENLLRWIQDPRSIEPHTIMPDTGVTDADARDIVAYLRTAR